MKAVFALLQENAPTQLDAANLAALFLNVLRYVPELAKIVDRLRAYCRRFDEKG